MKKALKIIGITFIVLVAVAAVVFFGFEKPIPKSWASKDVEQVRNYEGKAIDHADDIPGGTIKLYHEKITYTKDGDTVITTIAEKNELTLTKSGSGDSLKLKGVNVVYTDNGHTQTTTTTNVYKDGDLYYQTIDDNPSTVIAESGITGAYAFITASSLYAYTLENKPQLKANIKDMLENNLVKVGQKGLTLKFYLEKDNVAAEMTYKFSTKKITSYTEITKTYDADNNLTAKETYTLYL